jgi:hypothetical protein
MSIRDYLSRVLKDRSELGFGVFLQLPFRHIMQLEDAFLRQWGERKDHLYYLTEFGSLKKKSSETVMEFILRFNKLYNKIPAAVKPSEPSAKVTFAGAFEPDFALLLRERRGATLNRMQDDAVEIESNMMASGKLKAKVETVPTVIIDAIGNQRVLPGQIDTLMTEWMIWPE